MTTKQQIDWEKDIKIKQRCFYLFKLQIKNNICDHMMFLFTVVEVCIQMGDGFVISLEHITVI